MINKTAPQLLLIGGCPRSGTTWLQTLLADSEAVYSRPNETHLYDVYVEKLCSLYSSEKSLFNSGDGLRSLFDKKSFETELVKPFIDSVFNKYAEGIGSEEIVLEKTPSNIRYVELINRLGIPFLMVEIVRDPRAVVSSWRAAQKESWGRWARKSVFDICATWSRYIIEGDHAKYLLGDRIKRIKYEQLIENPVGTLDSIYGWLDINVPEDAIRAAVKKNDIQHVLSNRPLEDYSAQAVSGRKNFIRKGRADSWREDLPAGDVSIVEKYCGALMERLGYL
ncbi:sulfotransferase family protein [Microbulbifer sp. YPW16]|uniref:sulfotransferase family protein n=1 Tax=Microbulbifer sp. YPW16 TaxID=2904242 RepID=UPI001E4D8383|nr:sulfotransferase [Microbulbifer sp. YPW16]UHQ55871.1 sulfotransferase [Microbulbifer sp. YPW16]